MPYIRDYRRDELKLHCEIAKNPGELNFQITSLCSDFLAREGLCYENLNQAIGALECAKLELYSRIVRPYEDTKIRENGDVYPPALTGEDHAFT